MVQNINKGYLSKLLIRNLKLFLNPSFNLSQSLTFMND